MRIPPLLPVAHILAAVFATWRITELFTQDRITQKLRDKWPTYVWQCPRCMSVWAAVSSVLLYIYLPWLNWPFALAYFYLVHMEAKVQKRIALYGRRFQIIVQRDGKWEAQNDFTPQELQGLMNLAFPPHPPANP